MKILEAIEQLKELGLSSIVITPTFHSYKGALSVQFNVFTRDDLGSPVSNASKDLSATVRVVVAEIKSRRNAPSVPFEQAAADADETAAVLTTATEGGSKS